MKEVKFRIWRQAQGEQDGHFETYTVDFDAGLSLMESLDALNENLVKQGKDPVAFDSDCREGICGCCGFVVNGIAHGPEAKTTTCQLHMHHLSKVSEVVIEPFRAAPFPVIKDLMVDKSALERISRQGAYISVKTGAQPDANAVLIPKAKADEAFRYAACIGCGACVASCRNASANLFAGAKLAQFLPIPQGQAERKERARRILRAIDREGFGHCSNDGECTAACPKEIDTGAIAALNRESVRAIFSKL